MTRSSFLLSTLAFLVLLGVAAAAGPMLALAALGGLALVAAIWLWPHLGLAGMILAGVGVPMLASASEAVPVSITQLFAAVTFASYLNWALRNRVLPTYAPHMVAVLAFLAVVLLSILVSPDAHQSMVGASVYLRGALFSLIAAFLVTTRRSLVTVTAALTAACALCATLGVAEYLVPGFHIDSEDDLQYQRTGTPPSNFSLEDDTTLRRVSGGTGSFNWLAYTIAALLPLNFYWWRIWTTFYPRALLVALTAVQLGALMLTYTRSGLIGLAAAAVYLAFRARVSPWVYATALAAVLVTAPVWAPERFIDRLSPQYLKAGTSTMRWDFIATGFAMFKESPILGHGYGQFGKYWLTHSKSEYVDPIRDDLEKGGREPDAIRPHNLYIDIAVDYGLLGLGAYLWLMALVFRDLRQVERLGDKTEARLAIALQASFIAFLACGFFGNISIMRLPWALIGVAAALRRVTLERDQAAPESRQT